MSFDASERRPLAVMAVLLLGIFVFISVDLVTDSRAGASTLHLVGEFAIMAFSAIGAVLLLWRLRATRAAAIGLARDLETVQREAERWRSEASDLLAGLGAEIEKQFARWGLTPAERDVALLLLKGLSHKEVARARRTGERTVREQARAVYQKAGLSGRSELSAFFLSDLLLPKDARHGAV